MGKNKRQFLLSHQKPRPEQNQYWWWWIDSIFTPELVKIGLIRTWNCINGSSLCLFIDSQQKKELNASLLICPHLLSPKFSKQQCLFKWRMYCIVWYRAERYFLVFCLLFRFPLFLFWGVLRLCIKCVYYGGKDGRFFFSLCCCCCCIASFFPSLLLNCERKNLRATTNFIKLPQDNKKKSENKNLTFA